MLLILILGCAKEAAPATESAPSDMPAAAIAAPAPPKLPERPAAIPAIFVDPGACPGECCTYGAWTAQKPIALFDTIASTQPAVATLPVGEKVTVPTGEVHTVPQSARVKVETTLSNAAKGDEGAPPAVLQPGDVVWLLTQEGEGFSIVWAKGHRYSAEALFRYAKSCEGAAASSGGCWAEALVPFEETWWVKVQRADGSGGWSRTPDDFVGFDGCG